METTYLNTYSKQNIEIKKKLTVKYNGVPVNPNNPTTLTYGHLSI